MAPLFFVLRTPALPLATLTFDRSGICLARTVGEAGSAEARDRLIRDDRIRAREHLQTLLSRTDLRQAIELASPTFLDALDRWLGQVRTQTRIRYRQEVFR